MPYYNLYGMEKLRENETPLAEIQKVKGELMKTGLVSYNQGGHPRPHFHPNEEQFVFILEGKRYSILGDEEKVVGPGDLLHIPRNTRHCAITLDENVLHTLRRVQLAQVILHKTITNLTMPMRSKKDSKKNWKNIRKLEL